jgi:hypothetical protein
MDSDRRHAGGLRRFWHARVARSDRHRWHGRRYDEHGRQRYDEDGRQRCDEHGRSR